jgi:hypothetical protein
MNWNMLWMKSTFKLPEGYREILIKCGDSVDLGYFDPSTGWFVLNNGTSFNCRSDNVEWMSLVMPEVICGREIFYS